MTAHTEHIETQIADLRVAWWRKNLVSGLVVLVVVLIIMNGVALSLAFSNRAATREVRKNGALTLCVAALTADGIGGIGDAFATPPAPNPNRDEAIRTIIKAVQKLHQAQVICAKEIK